MYVYMSTTPVPLRGDGTPNHENLIYKRRGEVPDDNDPAVTGNDPASFARMMAARGFHVFTHPTDLGARVRCTSASFAPELLVAAE